MHALAIAGVVGRSESEPPHPHAAEEQREVAGSEHEVVQGHGSGGFREGGALCDRRSALGLSPPTERRHLVVLAHVKPIFDDDQRQRPDQRRMREADITKLDVPCNVAPGAQPHDVQRLRVIFVVGLDCRGPNCVRAGRLRRAAALRAERGAHETPITHRAAHDLDGAELRSLRSGHAARPFEDASASVARFSLLSEVA